MKIGLNNFTVELNEHQIEWEENANETIEYLKNLLGNLIIDACRLIEERPSFLL
jgi:hypothetical protein